MRGGLLVLQPGGAPVRLWVEECGHGVPILMLHGFGSSTYTWRHIAPPLARTRRVVAVDRKGAGRSDIPFDGAYEISEQVALLKNLIIRRHLSRLTRLATHLVLDRARS